MSTRVHQGDFVMFLPTSGEAIEYCIENSIKIKSLKKKKTKLGHVVYIVENPSISRI